MKVTLQESFKKRFPSIQEEDVFYDRDRDILHIGALKLNTGIQGEVYEVVLDENGFDAYSIGKYGHGYIKSSRDFLGNSR